MIPNPFELGPGDYNIPGMEYRKKLDKEPWKGIGNGLESRCIDVPMPENWDEFDLMIMELPGDCILEPNEEDDSKAVISEYRNEEG